MMKKLLMFATAAVLVAIFASCGAKKSEEATDAPDEKAFYEAQPLESGEYRAVSFQYGDAVTDRVRFDGRMILAVLPETTGIYIYENGNRTDFKATISLSKPFGKTDSVYTAQDAKGRTVKLIPTADIDTLVFEKGGKNVKLAFEKSPMHVLEPMAALEKITSHK